MLTHLKIERFKSIRHLELQCRRVNLLIGAPNTGKSNILDALGLLSWCGTGGNLGSFVRCWQTQFLFYDGLTDEPLRIEFQGEPAGTLVLKFENNQFSCFFQGNRVAQFSHKTELVMGGYPVWADCVIRLYRFRALEKFTSAAPGVLLPPDGPNLFSVIYGSKALRQWAAELFRPYGLLLILKPLEQNFELQKVEDGLAINYPFSACSDTLKRIVFYYAAIASNRDAVLAFEEPEAHAFPYYTKYLGEQIAADSANQYFIATHNPYLLEAVLEKASKDEVAVFATQYKDHQTKVTALTPEQIGRLLESDPFLGLEAVLEAG
jgi:AAA15 family ATPase/GTPase